MNQRIQLLSEQAEKYADDNFRGEPTWSEAFESKFAELIVRECEQVSLKSSHRNDDMGAIIARNIKKHFGIE